MPVFDLRLPYQNSTKKELDCPFWFEVHPEDLICAQVGSAFCSNFCRYGEKTQNNSMVVYCGYSVGKDVREAIEGILKD